jgi:hypothetical protein
MACAYRKKLAQHSLRRLIFNWRTTGAERAHFREPTDLPLAASGKNFANNQRHRKRPAEYPRRVRAEQLKSLEGGALGTGLKPKAASSLLSGFCSSRSLQANEIIGKDRRCWLVTASRFLSGHRQSSFPPTLLC